MLTADLVRERYHYDPETGVMTYRIKVAARVKVGDEVGHRHRAVARPGGRGYVATEINGRDYQVHRLIWIWMTGEEPQGEIDHINMDPWDNRWANLRLASRSQNMANRRGWAAHGFKGVKVDSRGRVLKFVARVRKDGRLIHIGTFDTPEEAHAAYCARAVELHGEYVRV